MTSPATTESRRPAATDFPALSALIGEVRDTDGGTRHDTAQIIRHLNQVLGEGNWSRRVVEHGVDTHEAWALTELQAALWIEDDEGILERHTVTFQDFGIQALRCDPPISLGQARQLAVADGLARCARLLGVGLYLWEGETAIELPSPHRPGTEPTPDPAPQRRETAPQEPAGAAQPARAPQKAAPPRQQPEKPAPMASGERAAWENKYEAVRVEAHDLGFMASWSSRPASAWTDEQLPKYVGLFESYIERTKSARRGAA